MQTAPDMRSKIASALVGALGLLGVGCSGGDGAGGAGGASTGGVGGSGGGASGGTVGGGGTGGTSTGGVGGGGAGGTAGSAPGGVGGIWRGDSAGIDFALTGPTAQQLCTFSATRAELTVAQLAGLSALRLHDGTGGAGCDVPSYAITIRAQDGSSASYRATLTICQTSPIVLFDEFNAWAKSTPCSWPRP